MEQRTAPKMSISNQDQWGNKQIVNLWGNMAQQFHVDVHAISSTNVRTFDTKINVSNEMRTCLFINPSIHETKEFRRKYVGPQYAPKIMTDAPKRQGKVPFNASTANLTTIKSLNKMRAISEKVVHGTRNDFVVKSAHPAINGAPGEPSNVPTPEKKTSKRSSVIIEEGNTNILPSQETPKKQKRWEGLEGVLSQSLPSIGSSKAKGLDDKWRKLQVSEMELAVEKLDLIREQAKLALEVMKSRKD